jgi:hypothetical protein
VIQYARWIRGQGRASLLSLRSGQVITFEVISTILIARRGPVR